MPAIARPASRQPPEPVSRREAKLRQLPRGAGEELAQKTLQGSADMRLWIVQEGERQRAKAFLCPGAPISVKPLLFKSKMFKGL